MVKSEPKKKSQPGGFFQKFFRKPERNEKEQRLTVQRSIPYLEMGRDGICRVEEHLYSKTVRFYDINYQLAQNEDKNTIFESWCDFLNYFDASIRFQLSFINHKSDMSEYNKVIQIEPQHDQFDDVRMEYAQMLKQQLANAVDETEVGGEKFFLLEHEEHGDMAACVAVNEQGKLVAEDLWNGFDEDFQEAVQKYFSEKWNMPKKEDVVSEIIEKATPVPDNSAQDYSDVPVYYEPFSYAKENDEVDLYRTSYRLNSECKQAIHEAIADNYDGMYLGDDAVDQVVRQYGMERVGYILANTLHHKSYDDRFSHSNKEWAEQVSTPEHDADRMTFRIDWVVDSHPAILDGFVKMFRKELEAQKKLEQEQPFVKQFYVVENLQAAPLIIERFDNLDDAMSHYQALPNGQL